MSIFGSGAARRLGKFDLDYVKSRKHADYLTLRYVTVPRVEITRNAWTLYEIRRD